METLDVPARLVFCDGCYKLHVYVAGVEYRFFVPAKTARVMIARGMPKSIKLG